MGAHSETVADHAVVDERAALSAVATVEVVLQLAHQAHGVSALAAVGFESRTQVASVGGCVEEVPHITGSAVGSGVAGETICWAVGTHS